MMTVHRRLHIYGAFVDYILEFAAGETEKTVSFTTEADSVNEGDGWLGVRIVPRLANPFSIGAGYAQVLVRDDDIPTVSLTQPTGPTGLTLSCGRHDLGRADCRGDRVHL